LSVANSSAEKGLEGQDDEENPSYWGDIEPWRHDVAELKDEVKVKVEVKRKRSRKKELALRFRPSYKMRRA
jgi:hypothetical protein